VEYYVYVPTTAARGAPVLVTVHGISRNARDMAKSFAKLAESRGFIVVSPHFSAERFGDYQRLGREGRGERADLALNAILEEVAWLAGAATDTFQLFGYSGGAQFAHRYTLAYPDRVAGAVIAAAGWYTFPDPRERFPYGIRRNRSLRGVRFDPEEFLQVPITVVVGDADTANDGLRRTARSDRQQGTTRVERARNWVAAMAAAAKTYHLDSRVAFRAIASGEHSFESLMNSSHLGPLIVEQLFGAERVAKDGLRAKGSPRGNGQAQESERAEKVADGRNGTHGREAAAG
jgi:poly(3-hydroxybutyrate) depolymerase